MGKGFRAIEYFRERACHFPASVDADSTQWKDIIQWSLDHCTCVGDVVGNRGGSATIHNLEPHVRTYFRRGVTVDIMVMSETGASLAELPSDPILVDHF
jgi:acetone carboxylase gamma subunit